MRLDDFIKNISDEGLRRLLNKSESYLYRQDLIDRLLDNTSKGEVYTYASSKQCLLSLRFIDLRSICLKNRLPTTGDKNELIDRILQHKEKIVTFEGVVKDITKWVPKNPHPSYFENTDDLQALLRRRGYYVENSKYFPWKSQQYRRRDLKVRVNDQEHITVLMRSNLKDKAEVDNAVGDVGVYTFMEGRVILVLCGHFRYEIPNRLVRAIKEQEGGDRCTILVKLS